MADKIKNYSSFSSAPIFVDLDGTLIKTDILIETFFQLIKKSLLYIFMFPLWLLRGKAYFKQMIADRVSIDAETLPYQQEFLNYLYGQFKEGRNLYLATASNLKYAQQVAEHLGIFKDIIASNSTINMSGGNKLNKIKEITDGKAFVYAGNAEVDMPIWQCADSCILVNPNFRVEKKVNAQFHISHVFKDDKNLTRELIKALRVHQWLKNILIFVPVLAAHQFGNVELLLQALLGFVAFSFCASSVYVLNDLFDLQSDRRHPSKKNRPFAAGSISIFQGMLLVPIFLMGCFCVSFFVSSKFLLVLVIYYIMTWSYSLYLKQLALVDVMTLAFLYVIRVVAGSAAAGIPLSFWLLAFSIFLFFSLALVKRVSELNTLKMLNRDDARGRGYFVTDLEYLHSMGVASGYISTLILALYINSEKVVVLYNTPEILWLTIPLVFYWVSRVWLKTGRGEVPDDPLLFAFRDLQSLLAAGVFFVVMIAAAFLRF